MANKYFVQLIYLITRTTRGDVKFMWPCKTTNFHIRRG